jgi:hypothetical protein
MSITVIPNIHGKVDKLNYEYKNFKFLIDVFVFSVTKLNDFNNIGFVLEKYRSIKKENDDLSAHQFFEINKPIFDKFISFVSYPFGQFIPDYLNLFFPSDKNRFRFLLNFSDTLLKHIPDWEKIDFSKNFKKNKPELSVIDNSNNLDFDLIIDTKIKKIDKLLMIDDTIDEGRTVQIFLDKLADNDLLSENTQIKLICVYNNCRSISVNFRDFLDN